MISTYIYNYLAIAFNQAKKRNSTFRIRGKLLLNGRWTTSLYVYWVSIG